MISEPLLTSSELAKWLNIKESTIRKKVSNNRIPYLKIGSSVRFRVEDIQQWLVENNPQNTLCIDGRRMVE